MSIIISILVIVWNFKLFICFYWNTISWHLLVFWGQTRTIITITFRDSSFDSSGRCPGLLGCRVYPMLFHYFLRIRTFFKILFHTFILIWFENFKKIVKIQNFFKNILELFFINFYIFYKNISDNFQFLQLLTRLHVCDWLIVWLTVVDHVRCIMPQ